MTRRRPVTLSFRLKLLLGLALVGLADLLFWRHPVGWTLGGFCLFCVATVAAASPAVWRNRTGACCLAFAALMGCALVRQPSLLALLLAWLALTAAVLTPRLPRVEAPDEWALGLIWTGVVGLAGPGLDLVKVRKYAHTPSPMRLLRLIPLLALPLIGGAVFLTLFSAANPLIARTLSSFQAPDLDGKWVLRALFWTAVFSAVWSLLRPHWRKPKRVEPVVASLELPPISAGTLCLSLAVFNLLFAVENVLDLAFLWSGASLPEGVTLADYAHRGAYPLIATALLAGGFVLFSLKPGSPAARTPLVRWLLIVWVAQNVFLVASSMLRTLDYVEAYNLTRMRIAALVWMGLVGVGLLLILWRILANRSGRWLVWSNGAALLAVLACVTVVDTGEVAADWNVRHAREVRGRGAELDFDYLSDLGPSALPALVWLEQQKVAPAIRAQAAAQRTWLKQVLQARQADWRGWTPNNVRRLSVAGWLPDATPASPPPRQTPSTQSAGS